MTLHHDMHHGAYVKNLNAAIEKHPELSKKTPEDLIRDLNSIPEDIRAAVRNNAGGHINHTMFWKIMKPKGGGDPTGPVSQVITKSFGNFKDSKPSSTTPASSNSAPDGSGSLANKAGTCKSSPPPIRTIQSRRASSHLRQRCLGTCLLPEIQQPPSRISGCLVERNQLGRNQSTL